MLERFAPAKINFGLEITARRPDGYHEIDTIFLPLCLFDRVRLEWDAEGAEVALEVRSTAPGTSAPAGPENLAWRAASEMRRALGLEAGLRIELEKHIPSAAGLGGGSSDAAAVLLGVEQLAGRTLEPAERRRIALGLGADVPFFLDPQPARGRGLGDLLTPLVDVPEMWWVLAALPLEVSTAWAYAQASRELTLPQRTSSIAALLGPSGVSTSPPNDLEPAATKRHPEIARARDALERAGAVVTGMSGSGPTVYGRFNGREEAARGAREAKLPDGSRAIVVSSLGTGQRAGSTGPQDRQDPWDR